MTDTLPTWADLESAAQQIAGVANHTPVETSRTINGRVNAEVFFKCENLQRGGAFKFRGAYNALSRLSADEKRRGVVSFSSGNHAQAVALAGQLLGIPCIIVMPRDTPPVKLEATAEYGAEILLYDRETGDREAIGRQLAFDRGLTLIPPFNHPHIIAGQGTAVKELIEDVGALDLLLVPCGGGGLLSGSSIAAKELSPMCRVVGVEPLAGDDAVQSFRTGFIQTVKNPDTIADGARTPSLGPLTFALIMQNVTDMTSVDDAALAKTMFYLWERLKLVVEPTGALGAAALLETGIAQGAQRIGVVLSGGNVDFSQVDSYRRLF